MCSCIHDVRRLNFELYSFDHWEVRRQSSRSQRFSSYFIISYLRLYLLFPLARLYPNGPPPLVESFWLGSKVLHLFSVCVREYGNITGLQPQHVPLVVRAVWGPSGSVREVQPLRRV